MSLRISMLLALILCLTLVAPITPARTVNGCVMGQQEVVDGQIDGVRQKGKSRSNGKKEKKKGSKKKKSKRSLAPADPGIPSLWEDRGEISSLDLYWGIGDEESTPKPPFRFDKEDETGSNPKIKVIDANGIKWNVKFAEEVHAEIAASRLVWACGYMVEESYYIPVGKVDGVSGLTRAKNFVREDGSFTNAMFEKRPDEIARRKINWSWEANPFLGSRELYGLAILNCLLNNWDAKSANNNVLGIFEPDGTTIRDWYLIADWGGTFGRTGTLLTHSKWNLAAYSREPLIDRVRGGHVEFHYSGKMAGTLTSIPLDHVAWFAGILEKFNDDQLRDIFRASGASPAEVDGFSRQLRKRIDTLVSIAHRKR